MNQTVKVQAAGGESDPGEISMGVRQGCSLSPVLFNIYTEAMMQEAFSKLEEVVRAEGKLVKSVRIADDMAVVCRCERELKRMSDNLNRVA